MPRRPELGHLEAASLQGPGWHRQADDALGWVLLFLQPARKIRDESVEGALEPRTVAANRH